MDPASGRSDLISRRSLPHSLPAAPVTGSPTCAAHSRLGALAPAVPAAGHGFLLSVTPLFGCQSLLGEVSCPSKRQRPVPVHLPRPRVHCCPRHCLLLKVPLLTPAQSAPSQDTGPTGTGAWPICSPPTPSSVHRVWHAWGPVAQHGALTKHQAPSSGSNSCNSENAAGRGQSQGGGARS